MKNLKLLFLATVAILLANCDNDDNGNIPSNNLPSAQEFNAIRQIALDNITQNFQIDASNGITTLTSTSGVEIDIDANCLTLNGNNLSGVIDIEYVEVFDGGQMLVTDKTTMGKMPNGDMAMLISGGEFFINATQNGQQLDLGCSMSFRIPADLTTPHNDMTLWNGIFDEDGNLEWEEEDNAPGVGGVFLEQQTAGMTYYAYFDSFGWTNVDKFYNYTGLKTQILASVPTGYNDTNCAIYLHYDGEGNALAKLDTYNSTTELFSEHYGQIPVGLACHIIFVTEENGQWRYAIKAITIAENAVYDFTLAETTIGSEDQIIDAINALP